MLRTLLIALLLSLTSLGCTYDPSPAPPDAGISTDVECKRWCGEQQSCTGEPWLECLDECLAEPELLELEPCPQSSGCHSG